MKKIAIAVHKAAKDEVIFIINSNVFLCKTDST